jgi:hypothetical protein
MSLEGHYQNAYVTHDLEAGMALVTARFGVTDYIRFAPEVMHKTPDGEKLCQVSVALAWTGGLQIELIQPIGGYVEPYRALMPADTRDIVPRFHHVAVRRDDLDAMRREIAAEGLPLAFEGEVPGLVYVYLDARNELGHFLEYVWATPEGWEMIGWPEGRSLL